MTRPYRLALFALSAIAAVAILSPGYFAHTRQWWLDVGVAMHDYSGRPTEWMLWQMAQPESLGIVFLLLVAVGIVEGAKRR